MTQILTQIGAVNGIPIDTNTRSHNRKKAHRKHIAHIGVQRKYPYPVIEGRVVHPCGFESHSGHQRSIGPCDGVTRRQEAYDPDSGKSDRTTLAAFSVIVSGSAIPNSGRPHGNRTGGQRAWRLSWVQRHTSMRAPFLEVGRGSIFTKNMRRGTGGSAPKGEIGVAPKRIWRRQGRSACRRRKPRAYSPDHRCPGGGVGLACAEPPDTHARSGGPHRPVPSS